ncbi:hypothetical protein F5Y08DRAFT_348131 [Xylaria arbuscula]|nr:hypothetical protein F5Y08DRAFT_348131 [Xylaria arbuscula]
MSNYSNLVDKIQAGLKASSNTWVPPPYHWNDGDPPADDLLAARLRAKYWDLQVILYRPFLQQILHRDQPQTHVGEELLTNARLAIQAVIESLRPFHGLRGGQRLIITNMLETAHSIREELNNEKSRSGSKLNQLQQQLDQLGQEFDKLKQRITGLQLLLGSFKSANASQSS